MASQIITGRDGYVNGIACLQSWSRERTGSNARYAASCTDRGTGVTDGNVNETVSMSGIGGNPSIVPGAEISFKGVIDNTAMASKVLDGTVLITGLSITCPKEAGTEITWTATGGVQGTLVPGTTGAADATYLEHIGASVAASATVDNGGSPYTIPGMRGWTLNINCPEKTYVSDKKTYRKPGNMEADISIDVYGDEPYDVKYDVNVRDKLKLFIDATTFWLFEWIKFTGTSNFVVNRATQEIIGYTINGMWTAVGGTALGHITKPGGTHLFGS